MNTVYMPQEIKDGYLYVMKKARENREWFLTWLQQEIEEAIKLINQYDKIYVLGFLGSKLIKASPSISNQFLANYTGEDKDQIREDELLQDDPQIETMLEYAMSIATASDNHQTATPTKEELEAIYEKLSSIKSNVGFYEMTAEIPAEGNEADQWLRFIIVTDSMNVRGDGYQMHITQVYKELFEPFSGFLETAYGFNHHDLLKAILKMDTLVGSKIGNTDGTAQSHARLKEWMEKNGENRVMEIWQQTGKHFIQQFTEANPDLYNAEQHVSVLMHDLNTIASFPTVFWVIPQEEKEIKIFEKLSISFGENNMFFQPPKFRAFPLNDTEIQARPLIKHGGKYFHFSTTLGFRNIFKIAEKLIRDKDAVYFDNYYRNNSSTNSRDNYIELKTKSLFQQLLPHAKIYHGLKYDVTENEVIKHNELDLLALTASTAYIIEVKAGELNAKHRRGAMKGLKSRLDETINKGSFQCHRALKYLQDNENPTFTYSEKGKQQKLIVDKTSITAYYKIAVTFEQFSAISANLQRLIDAGVLQDEFKWSWIISIYDLFVFADLIENETDFNEYLDYRLGLYDKENITFEDETDVLGYYFEGNFPITTIKDDEHITITGFKDEIDEYYTKKGLGFPGLTKPKKK